MHNGRREAKETFFLLFNAIHFFRSLLGLAASLFSFSLISFSIYGEKHISTIACNE